MASKVKEFLQQQTRFQMLAKSKPEHAKRLWEQAQQDVEARYRMYEFLAQRKTEAPKPATPSATEKKTEEPSVPAGSAK